MKEDPIIEVEAEGCEAIDAHDEQEVESLRAALEAKEVELEEVRRILLERELQLGYHLQRICELEAENEILKREVRQSRLEEALHLNPLRR
jgi:hypothetical protein